MAEIDPRLWHQVADDLNKIAAISGGKRLALEELADAMTEYEPYHALMSGIARGTSGFITSKEMALFARALATHMRCEALVAESRASDQVRILLGLEPFEGHHASE